MEEQLISFQKNPKKAANEIHQGFIQKRNAKFWLIQSRDVTYLEKNLISGNLDPVHIAAIQDEGVKIVLKKLELGFDFGANSSIEEKIKRILGYFDKVVNRIAQKIHKKMSPIISSEVMSRGEENKAFASEQFIFTEPVKLRNLLTSFINDMQEPCYSVIKNRYNECFEAPQKWSCLQSETEHQFGSPAQTREAFYRCLEKLYSRIDWSDISVHEQFIEVTAVAMFFLRKKCKGIILDSEIHGLNMKDIAEKHGLRNAHTASVTKARCKGHLLDLTTQLILFKKIES